MSAWAQRHSRVPADHTDADTPINLQNTDKRPTDTTSRPSYNVGGKPVSANL